MDTNETRRFADHVVQVPMEVSFCAGCASCEAVCSLTHDGLVSPSYNRLFMQHDTRTMIHTILTCSHCTDHPCYSACPKKDKAMCVDKAGIVYIEEEECIGCGLCAKACAFTPSRINMVKSKDRKLRKAKKCDLCRNRKEGPACIQYCPSRCLVLSSQQMGGEPA